MKTSSRIIVLLAILLLSSTFFVNIANAYSGYVGEKISLPNPTVSGTLGATVWESSDNSLVSVDAYGIAQINTYFSGQLAITCMYTYSYVSGGKVHYVTNQHLNYYITCKQSTITLNKSEITLNIGEDEDLTYTNSSGYDLPFVEWTTSNESVAKILYDLSSKNKVIGPKSITIDPIGEGQCTITCDGKNGSKAVTCKVTVIDNRWVKSNVNSGGVKKGTKVTLSCTKTGATIYYTTDESEPSKNSAIYTSPIEINNNMTLKAKAYLGSQESATSQWKYVVTNHLDGEIFTEKTKEGVEISYKTYVSSQSAYCLVSSGSSNIAAIDNNYSGHLTIPEYADGIRVRGIGERAFYNCKITSISFPTYTGNFNSTTFTIGKYAFEYSNLTSLIIPKKIHADIKEGAFRLCTNLETITFEHYTLEGIGIYAFEGCSGIKTIYSYVTTPPKLLDKRFDDKTLSNAILYVPKDKYNNYRYSTWNKFKNIVEMGSDSPSPSSSIEINATNFPDANFRNYLQEQDYGKDGVITSDEISGIKTINITSKEIKTLKGVEYFTSLTQLWCNSNQLTSLDVSKNTALTELECSSNQLNSLDVSKNTALTYLACDHNQLTSLDVSRNTALTKLWCDSNQLTSLDVSKNIALKELNCSYNQLTSLDVTKNTSLKYLWCDSNQLTSLDVSKNSALTKLGCSSNQLTSMDISKNTGLKDLWCYSNQLTSLDVSNNSSLTKLGCRSNQLASLDVSKNSALTELSCSSNQLTSLDVSKNIALIWLECGFNLLISLDISKNTALEYLWCGSNQLTSMDISKNTGLKELWCYSNQLTSLNVSQNKELEQIDCSENSIKEAAMDYLIKSLNNNTTGQEHKIYVMGFDDREENVCTKNQVAAIKAKGWTPYDVYGNEYTGSDPSGINGILLDEEKINRIFDLSGKPLPKPRKGINIIDGKKVIVR